MTEILLQTKLNQDTQLQKIGATMYWNPKDNILYKLSFMPSNAIFYNQDVIQPHVLSLTQHNPYLFAINQLIRGKIELSHVPPFLKNVDFEKIADKVQNSLSTFYALNKEKVYDFLEKKVAKLHLCFEQNFQKNYIMTEEKQKRFLTDEIITILKMEINDHLLIDQFAKERYDYSTSRKKMPENEEEESPKKVHKSKPKKDPKKSEPKLGHNQKTLSQFFAKPKQKIDE